MGRMRRPIRRLPALLTAVLAAAPLAVLGAGAVGAPSYAAGCPAFQPASALQADAVFDGRIAGPPATTRAGGPVTYPVAVQSSYSGTATGRIAVRMPAGPCQPKALTQGEDYVFLVSHSGSGWTTAAATPSVVPYQETLNQQLHRLLDKPAPTPPTVTFGEPISGPPSSFTRVAAPGAAMFIVGLLGYAVVRRLGRRAP